MATDNQKSSKKVMNPGKEISESTAEEFGKKILASLEGGMKDLVIDMNGVEVVDALGLGTLAAAQNSLENVGGALTIRNSSEDISALLKTMGFDRHLAVQMGDQ